MHLIFKLIREEIDKFGLKLAAIHTIAVFCAVVWSLVSSYRLATPVWFLLYAIDFPAIFLLLFDTFPVPESYPWYKFMLFALLFGMVGGIWWFSIGWIVATCHSRLAVGSAATRFASVLAIVLVVVVVVLGVQFFFTIPNTADDGCASVGFPVAFFRGCYGTFSLFWPAMTVSKRALALDVVVWLSVALLFSYYLSRKTRHNDGNYTK